jgi:hypothetical protein
MFVRQQEKMVTRGWQAAPILPRASAHPDRGRLQYRIVTGSRPQALTRITVFGGIDAPSGLPVSGSGTSERPNPFHADISASRSGHFQNPIPSGVLPFLTRIQNK